MLKTNQLKKVPYKKGKKPEGKKRRDRTVRRSEQGIPPRKTERGNAQRDEKHQKKGLRGKKGRLVQERARTSYLRHGNCKEKKKNNQRQKRYRKMFMGKEQGPQDDLVDGVPRR